MCVCFLLHVWLLCFIHVLCIWEDVLMLNYKCCSLKLHKANIQMITHFSFVHGVCLSWLSFTIQLNIIFLLVVMCEHLIVEYLIKNFDLSIQAIQVGATKVLSLLLTISDYSQPYFSGNACFGLDDNQVWHLCLCSYFYTSHLVLVSAVIVSFAFIWVNAGFRLQI